MLGTAMDAAKGLGPPKAWGPQKFGGRQRFAGRQRHTDFRTVAVPPDYWGFCLRLAGCDRRVRPHPPPRRSKRPARTLCPGGFALELWHRAHGIVLQLVMQLLRNFPPSRSQLPRSIAGGPPIPTLSLWRLIIGQSWAAQVRARHRNGRKFVPRLYRDESPCSA